MVRRRAFDIRKLLATIATVCIVPLLAFGQCVSYAPSREAAERSAAGARSSNPVASTATQSDGVDGDESTILLSGISDPQRAGEAEPGLRTVLAEPIESEVPVVDSQTTLQISATEASEPSAEHVPWNVLPGAITPSAEELQPAPIRW